MLPEPSAEDHNTGEVAPSYQERFNLAAGVVQDSVSGRTPHIVIKAPPPHSPDREMQTCSFNDPAPQPPPSHLPLYCKGGGGARFKCQRIFSAAVRGAAPMSWREACFERGFPFAVVITGDPPCFDLVPLWLRHWQCSMKSQSVK